MFDTDKAMASNDFGLALNILKTADKSKVDSEQLQKKLLQIQASYKTNQNNNVVDIQNIFKSGENITISYFDNSGSIKPSNVDIEIYKGGYGIDTVLYNLGSSGYQNFELPNASDTIVSASYDLVTSASISGMYLASYTIYQNGVLHSITGSSITNDLLPYVVTSNLFVFVSHSVYPTTKYHK